MIGYASLTDSILQINNIFEHLQYIVIFTSIIVFKGKISPILFCLFLYNKNVDVLVHRVLQEVVHNMLHETGTMLEFVY